MYLNNVYLNDYSGRIEVGIYDPDRFEGEGGMRFGFTAEVNVHENFHADGPYVEGKNFIAEVSQSSIGVTSPEEADLRIDVYQQATDIARFINQELRLDVSWKAISQWLQANLPTGPHADRFRYDPAQDCQDHGCVKPVGHSGAHEDRLGRML